MTEYPENPGALTLLISKTNPMALRPLQEKRLLPKRLPNRYNIEMVPLGRVKTS